MLLEGSQDAIRHSDNHGHDFSRVICEHCENWGNIGSNIFEVETKYGKAYVHDVCGIEYKTTLAE